MDLPTGPIAVFLAPSTLLLPYSQGAVGGWAGLGDALRRVAPAADAFLHAEAAPKQAAIPQHCTSCAPMEDACLERE